MKILFKHLSIVLIFSVLSFPVEVDGQHLASDVFCECGPSTATVDHEVISVKAPKGRIVINPDKPVAEAKVLLTDKSFNKVVAKTLSDSGGYFSFEVEKPKRLFVVVCKDGYSRARVVLEIDPEVSRSYVILELLK